MEKENTPTEQLETMLREVRDLTRQNHELLKKVRHVQKITQITKIFYFLFIIGIAFGAFYFVQPYIQSLMGIYSGISGQSENMNSSSFSDLNYIQDLVKQFQGENQSASQ